MTAAEMYIEFTKLARGHRASVIKNAGWNLLLATITMNSSNVDEATAQWNELSNQFEEAIRFRFKVGNIIKPDDFAQIKPIINGDR